MQTGDMILANEFCVHHNIELSFIHSLQEAGLVTIVIVEEKQYFPEEQLPNLEKLVRLYYDLDINVEGIETISHLLQQIRVMQQQIVHLTNRLCLYEDK